MAESKEKSGLLYQAARHKNLSELVDNLLYHDAELGLYSLAWFKKFYNELTEKNILDEYAICYFNIRHLGILNQSLRREEVNHLIIAFTNGLEVICEPEGTVARVSGGDFLAIFRRSVIDQVREYLEGTVLNYGKEMNNSVLIAAIAGVFPIPENYIDAESAIDLASWAYKEARAGSKQFLFFDEDLSKIRENKEMVEASFPNAMINNEFKVYYQPKVNVKNYTLVGAEALCRWFHNGTMIRPDEFIPVLEQNHSICSLDYYMLDHVCADIRKWIDEGKPVVKVSVNFSRLHLGNIYLFKQIMDIIDSHRVPHEYIEIELTETTTDANFSDLKRIVELLQKNGISTSIDDFGCGYSSLNLMRSLPWDVLKIDKSFLKDTIEGGSHSNSVLSHVISMAQEQGIECIVEGVETIEHLNLIKENNCFLAQGFLFDKPLPKDEFEERLNRKLEAL